MTAPLHDDALVAALALADQADHCLVGYSIERMNIRDAMIELRNSVDAFRAALTASQAPAPADDGKGWQSIETAPKSGTKIDLWTRLDERHMDCQWERNRWVKWGRDGFESPGWETVQDPTHWRLPPAAPSKESGHEG